jgi:hypothetical protein
MLSIAKSLVAASIFLMIAASASRSGGIESFITSQAVALLSARNTA